MARRALSQALGADSRSDFEAIEAAIAGLTEERARGDAFERVVAHFLRHDPTVGMRRVWTWLDWSGRLVRPYQATAVADVVSSLTDHERTQLVMACGSGKTLVTLWIAEARADERVLVVVPTLLLLKQFRREWRKVATLPFVDLAVCS